MLYGGLFGKLLDDRFGFRDPGYEQLVFGSQRAARCLPPDTEPSLCCTTTLR